MAVKKAFDKKARKLRLASFICKCRCCPCYIWISGFFRSISRQWVAALCGLMAGFHHPSSIIIHEIHQPPRSHSACSWASARLGTIRGWHLGVSFPSNWAGPKITPLHSSPIRLLSSTGTLPSEQRGDVRFGEICDPFAFSIVGCVLW